MNEELMERLERIASEIELGMDCTVRIGDTGRGPFVQIQCRRLDVITKEMGTGRGGKAYPSDYSSDSEIIQMIFGLYLSYWTHEARENFQWRGRRVFGPHISTEALWEAAPHLDLRSARHEEDKDAVPLP
jgi:hypothetical protein